MCSKSSELKIHVMPLRQNSWAWTWKNKGRKKHKRTRKRSRENKWEELVKEEDLAKRRSMRNAFPSIVDARSHVLIGDVTSWSCTYIEPASLLSNEIGAHLQAHVLGPGWARSLIIVDHHRMERIVGLIVPHVMMDEEIWTELHGIAGPQVGWEILLLL